MKNAWRSLYPGATLIILLTVVAYVPAMRGGFIWDDRLLISENRIVRASDGLYRFWFTTEAPDYWPLTSTTWWLEWRLWGDSATGYHVVNVLLHAVNAILVWIILRRLKIPGAWLAGLVFAVHPVNVATVAWISEQKNTLSMLFYAVAILLYLRFDEEGRWRWYGLSLAAFLLALLSKSAVVMLPVVLLGCIWWTRGKVRWKDFLRCGPFFVLSLVLGLVTIWFQHHQALGGYTIRAASFPSRLAAAGWVPWFYLYKALLPVNLTVIYPKWEIDASRWVSYLPGIILVGCLIVFWWRRKTWGRPLLFGLGYFVVMLFPVLGFFHQSFHRFSLVADHWQYCSLVGAIALSVAAGERICRRTGEQRRSLGTVAGVVVLMVLAVATWRWGHVYAHEETLWRDNLAKNPNAWVAHYNLGVASEQAGKLKEAIAHYEQALRIKPDYAEAHNNLGLVLLGLGKVPEAAGHFEQALRLKHDYAGAHSNLGLALFRLGNVSAAMEQYAQALRLSPDFAEAHYNVGDAMLQQGRLLEAIAHYERALRAKPDYALAHNNLGLALFRLGRVSEAIAHYQQALQLKPDYAGAHCNLGDALLTAGRASEAIGQYEQALRIKPDLTEARYNLGMALAGLGRLTEAKEHCEQVLRIKPDFPDAHYSLGIIFVRLGKLTEAKVQFEQALRIRPNDPRAHNHLGACLMQLGSIAEAKEQFEQALRIKPDFPDAQINLDRARLVQ
jgi:tetratricopeptide (TPR) repeat protein